MQTKKESIGYILLGVLHSNIPSNLISEVARVSLNVVNELELIDNYRTLAFAKEIAERMNLDDIQIKSLQGGVYYQFDMKTEEEAGLLYDYFTKIFPILKKR